MHFSMLKADGQYEGALVALSEAVRRFREQNNSAAVREALVGADEDVDDDGSSLERWLLATLWPASTQPPWPWLARLDPYHPVACFEAIRAGEHASELPALSHACIELAAWEDWRCDWERGQWDNYDWDNEPCSDDDAADGEAHVEFLDKLPEFWRVASGWVDAQLSPSDLRKALQEREDEAAERRVQRYFFGEQLWAQLPERARRSLTSADRDWFSAGRARKESILNELRIAAEELLFHGLWIPLCRWRDADRSPFPTQEFDEMRSELGQLRHQPASIHFEKVCRMEMTKIMVKEWGISEDERRWLLQRLPKALWALRLKRGLAEHEWSGQSTEMELRDLFSEFVGVGREGVLRRLAVLLLPHRRT